MRPWIVALALVAGSCLEGQHAPGVTEVEQEDCLACHEDTWATAPDVPEHQGEPACANCHTTTDWAEIQHPENKFPIANGAHSEDNGVTCDSCHLGALTEEAVSCLDCHEHRESEVTDEHREVSSFEYDPSRPAFCRDCHPTGRE